MPRRAVNWPVKMLPMQVVEQKDGRTPYCNMNACSCSAA